MQSHSLVSILALLSPICVVAQSDRSSIPGFDANAVSAHSCGIETIDGTLWAGGEHYKASFTANGVIFVPALGRRSARTHSVALACESIGRGQLAPVAAATALVSPAERRVGYARNGVTELYDVRPDGLEQHFVFRARPEGEGGLVVRLRLTTDLALATTTAREVRFDAPQLGGVCVRDVFGVDARGARCEGTLRVVDAGPYGERYLDLILPAAFVDRAAYPLDLDPWIGTVLLPGAGPDDEYPDVAYEPTQDTYLVVWDRSASVINIDLVGQRVSAAGTLVGGLATLRQGVTGLSRNRVVAVDARDLFVAAWYEGGVSFRVWACTVQAGTGAVGAALPVTSASAVAFDPEVGVVSAQDPAAIVVWHDATSNAVRGCRLDVAPSGSLTAGPEIPLSAAGSGLLPRVSRSSRTSGRMLVTWTHPTIRRVDGAVVDGNLQVLSSFAVLGVTPDLRAQCVDGDGTDWIVAYERGNGYPLDDVYCRPLHYDATTNHVAVGAEVPVANQTTVTEIDACIAWLGNAAAIGYVSVADWAGPAWTTSVVVKVVDAFTCAPCQPVAVATMKPAMWGHGLARLAARPGGPGAAAEALLVFNELPPGNQAFVAARAFRSDDGLEWGRGGGCGGGSTLHGCAAVGNAGYSLRLREAPASAPTFVFVGTAVVNAPCGPCVVVPDPASGGAAFAGVTDTSGGAGWSLPIPAQASLVGFGLFAQWLTLGPPGSCLGLALSDALEIQLQ